MQIAFFKGQKAIVDLRPLMVQRLIHTGSTLRPRSPAEKAVIAEALKARSGPLLGSGPLQADHRLGFPLAEASKAHERIESADHVGKVVLRT